MTSNVTILKSIAMSILLHTICGSFKTVLGRRPSANVYSTTSIATSTSTRMHRLHSNYNAAFQFGSFSTCRNTRSEFGLDKELPSQSRLRSKSKLYYLKQENRKNNKDFNKGFFSPSVYSRNFSKFASIESEQIETDTTPTEEGEEDSLNDYEFDVILDSLNDAQIKAVTQPTQSITRVVAGPGAGKTRVLTCRIAYLLKRDIIDMNPNSRILAVTFTKKASTEMQHRLNLLLRDDEEYQNNLKRSMVKDGGESEEGDIDPDTIVEEMAPNDGTDDNRPAPPLLTSRVTLGTFHSICAKILRWHGKELDSLPTLRQYLPKKANDSVTLDGSFAIIDQSEQMRIIKQCLTDCGIDLKGSGTRGQADIRPVTILNAVGQIKSDEALDVMSGDRDNEKSNGRKMSSKVRRIAEEVYPLYRKALLAQNSLDFDDLILMARELLKTNTEVRERMQKRWQHILVDEFQDTSEVQLDLVKLLSTSSLLIVGDGDQSIYSWRGAHAESMSDFVKEFNKRSGGVKQKEVDTVFLMENYRSTTNIVKAAQKVISNPSTKQSPQDSVRQDMKPMRGKGPSPRILACAHGKAEASFVVKEINKMIDAGTIHPGSTVALIYRTNAQSRALEEACVANNLQYLVRGSAGTFYSRAEIKDCLCFLRWIYNGRDRSAMLRAIKTPSRGLGDVSMNEFSAYCNEVENQLQNEDIAIPTTPLDILLSLADSPDNSPYIPPDGMISKRTMNRLVPFASQMKKLKEKAEIQTVAELLGTIIESLNLKSHFDSISKTSEEFADRWANVNELRSASERYSADGSCLNKKKVQEDDDTQVTEMSPLGNFLDDVSLLTDVEGSSEDDEESGERRLVANLMTIHASKGMEFDCVFLVGNEEGTFPTQRSISEGEGSIELDEERRLCYVAMTRAKTHLVMTWRREVQTFFGQGFKISNPERSRFLDRLVSKKSQNVVKNKKGTADLDLRRRREMLKQRGLHTSTRNRNYSNAEGRLQQRRVQSPVKRRTYGSMEGGRQERRMQPPIKRKTYRSIEGRRQEGRSIQGTRKVPQRNQSIRDGPPPSMMDSSLFFPVGSSVRHSIHGEGKVATPKPVSNGGKMMVSVTFKSGMQVDFPVQNSGLTITR